MSSTWRSSSRSWRRSSAAARSSTGRRRPGDLRLAGAGEGRGHVGRARLRARAPTACRRSGRTRRASRRSCSRPAGSGRRRTAGRARRTRCCRARGRADPRRRGRRQGSARSSGQPRSAHTGRDMSVPTSSGTPFAMSARILAGSLMGALLFIGVALFYVLPTDGAPPLWVFLAQVVAGIAIHFFLEAIGYRVQALDPSMSDDDAAGCRPGALAERHDPAFRARARSSPSPPSRRPSSSRRVASWCTPSGPSSRWC